jgi:hypothetical protein
MDQQTFQLLQEQHRDVMKRFDNLELLHADHAKEDREVHKLVERHNMYFNVAFLGIPTLFTALAYKLGYK